MEITQIESRIHLIRGHRVMLDSDLAWIYGIPTFRFNEAVKRNRARFPRDFMFRLSDRETACLTSHPAMSNPGRGGRRTRPYAFTEHGAVMAANILNSPRAVQMSVFVIRAFVRMRGILAGTESLSRNLASLEIELKKRLDVHESVIVDILRRVMDLLDPPPDAEPPRRRIGFHAPGAKEEGKA